MKINDKIYLVGLKVMDELLLHRNSSKTTFVSIEDASILSEYIIYFGPHTICTFSELEITKFYQDLWKRGKTK